MAAPKVGGLRTTRAAESSETTPAALPSKKSGLYQFRSRAASLRYSVRRRRIERGPDGEKEEVSPRTKDGHDAPLDWVIFENNYFETASRELAEAFVAKVTAMGQYGVGAEVWSLEDERRAQDDAAERELRARVEANPEIAARLGFKPIVPGEAQDFELPPS